MIITWWMKLRGNLPQEHEAILLDKWNGIFYMSSHTDTTFIITQAWTTMWKQRALVEVKVFWHKADSYRGPVGPQSTTPTTRPRCPSQVWGSIIPRVLHGGGDLLPIGGLSAITAPPCVEPPTNKQDGGGSTEPHSNNTHTSIKSNMTKTINHSALTPEQETEKIIHHPKSWPFPLHWNHYIMWPLTFYEFSN